MSLKWQFRPFDRWTEGSPAIGSDGSIYVIAGEALQAVVDGGSQGQIKDGDWPFGGYDYPAPDVDTRVFGIPVLGIDEAVYVRAVRYEWHPGDPLPWAEETPMLYAVNPNGTRKWRLETDSRHMGTPAVSLDGNIYMVVGGELQKISMTGDLLGGIRLATEGPGHAPPTIGTDGKVYFGGYRGVYKYDLSAENPDDWVKKWDCILPGDITSSLVIGKNNVLYVGADDGHLYAIDCGTGRLLAPSSWLGGAVRSAPAIGRDGIIYVGADDHQIHALNPEDGQQKWAHETRAPIRTSPVVGADGYIYVVSMDGRLYQFRSDGTGEETFVEVGRGGASPTMGRDGTVYGVAENRLWAVATDSNGVADSAWPMYRHNRHHSNSAQRLFPNGNGDTRWNRAYRQLFRQESDLDLLRRFRDEFLTQRTIEGKRYVSLLYESSAEALAVLTENPELERRANELIAAHRSTVHKVLEGQRGIVRETDEVFSFVGDFAEKSPPALRQLLNEIRETMQQRRRMGRPFLGLLLD